MNSNRRIFVIVCIVVFLGFFLTLSAGSLPLTSHDFSLNKEHIAIFWQLRLPRALTALVCGSLLALAGLMMQLLLQNPLADPYILGISSGSALVTLSMMLIGFNNLAYHGGAWLGSLLSIGLLMGFGKKHAFQAHALLLMGVSLAACYAALISFLLLICNAATLHAMLFWLTGDLAGVGYPYLGCFILVVTTCLLCRSSQGLNLLLRGEREAAALGLPVRRYKVMLFSLSALCTAQAVTLAGCIGFVGLIVPHIARQLMGQQHQWLVPVTGLLGGGLIMFADALSRYLLAPQQLPIGILLTLIGVPIFIFLLQKNEHASIK